MAALRYLAPFAFLVLVALGAWMGGAWTFAAAFATAFGLASFDWMFGKESRPAEAVAKPALRWVPALYIALQLPVTAWIAMRIAGGQTSAAETVGLTISNALATGVFGMSASHAMIHGRSRSERAIGLLFLASVFYMHFRISHIYGHHRRAATFEDPASARLGEGLYAFLRRCIGGQFREAWHYEARRQRRAGRAVFNLRNRMIGYAIVELAIIMSVGWLSIAALAFVLVNAGLAILLLETFNYVAHYGLTRGSARAAVPLGPEHSWNSSNWMNNAALFNMGRHSDHHRHNARSYPQLRPIGGNPELPAGYAAAMLTALVPPLWRRTMDQRALEHRFESTLQRRFFRRAIGTRAAGRIVA